MCGHAADVAPMCLTGAAGLVTTGGKKKRPRTPRKQSTPRTKHVCTAVDAASPPPVPGFVAKRTREQGRDDNADVVPNENHAPMLQAVNAGGGAVLADMNDMCGMRNRMRDMQTLPSPAQPLLPALRDTRDTSGGRQEAIGKGDKGTKMTRAESLEEKASSVGQPRQGLQQVPLAANLKINASTLILNTKKIC